MTVSVNYELVLASIKGWVRVRVCTLQFQGFNFKSIEFQLLEVNQ